MHPIIIRPRCASIDEWNIQNIILRKSEIAVVQNDDVTDYSEPKFKLGDGITPFKDLPYVTIHKAFRDGIIYTKGGIYTTIKIDYMYRGE